MKYWLWISVLTILLLGVSLPAMARTCQLQSVTPPSGNLGGTIPSTQVRTSSLHAQTGFTIQCTGGTILGLFSYDTTNYIVESSLHNFRLYNGRHYIPYQLSSEANFATVVDQVGQGYSDIDVSLLVLLNNRDIHVPLHIRTLPANVSAGEYTGQLGIRVTGRYCAVQVTVICLSFGPPLNALITVNIRLTVDRSCSVQMPAVHDFGSIGLISDAVDYRLNVDIDCTISETYRLYIDQGNHFTNGWREMRAATDDAIRYRVLLPQQDIDLTQAAPMQRVGIGAVERVQPRVRLDPAQTTPPPGVYSDTIRAVIVY